MMMGGGGVCGCGEEKKFCILKVEVTSLLHMEMLWGGEIEMVSDGGVVSINKDCCGVKSEFEVDVGGERVVG